VNALLYFQIANNHSYEWNKDNVWALEVLEQQYQQKRSRRKSFTSYFISRGFSLAIRKLRRIIVDDEEAFYKWMI